MLLKKPLWAAGVLLGAVFLVYDAHTDLPSTPSVDRTTIQKQQLPVSAVFADTEQKLARNAADKDTKNSIQQEEITSALTINRQKQPIERAKRSEPERQLDLMPAIVPPVQLGKPSPGVITGNYRVASLGSDALFISHNPKSARPVAYFSFSSSPSAASGNNRPSSNEVNANEPAPESSLTQADGVEPANNEQAAIECEAEQSCDSSEPELAESGSEETLAEAEASADQTEGDDVQQSDGQEDITETESTDEEENLLADADDSEADCQDTVDMLLDCAESPSFLSQVDSSGLSQDSQTATVLMAANGTRTVGVPETPAIVLLILGLCGLFVRHRR